MLLGAFDGRGRVVGLLALGAQAIEVNGILRDPEAGAPAVRKRQVVQPRVFEVNHAIALYADQMMVVVGIGVEPGCRPKMVGTPDRAELNQRLERSVDRPARDLRNLRPNRITELLCGGVVVAKQHRLQDHAPLHRELKTHFTAAILEDAQDFSNGRRTFWHSVLHMICQRRSIYAEGTR